MRIWLLFLAYLMAASAAFANVTPKQGAIAADRVLLNGLDKLTGEVVEIAADVNGEVKFKKLRINILACHYPKGRRGSDSYALLHIQDERNDKPTFFGWMFAESPGLNAMEHPRYDIWVIRCASKE